MKEYYVSLFKSGTTVTHPQHVPAVEILREIQRGKYKADIERLRKVKRNKKAYDAKKKTLPGVTWAGMFSKRCKAGFDTASGLFPIDLDHLEDVQGVKNALKQDKSVLFAFVSPGGDGIKAAYRIPPVKDDAQFKRVFAIVKERVKERTGLPIDEQRKDISGLCFVSYDPELYLNENAELLPIDFDIFEREQAAKQQEQQRKQTTKPAQRLSVDDKTVERWIQWKVDAATDMINQSVDGERRLTRFKAGRLLGGVISGFGAGFFSVENAVSVLLPVASANTDHPENVEKEIRDGIASGLDSPLTAEEAQAKFEDWKAQHPLEHHNENRPPHPADTYSAPARTEPPKQTAAPEQPPAQQNTPNPKKQPLGRADAIRSALKHYKFSLNELTDRIMVNGDPLTDEKFSEIYCELVNADFRGAELFDHVIRAESAKTKYHPVKDYLNGLQWDKRGHIAKLAGFFKDDDNVFGLYLRKWLIGAVAKAFEGKQNPVLVLVGEQGLGKGYLSKWLCPLPEIYIESPIIPDSNDNKLRLTDRFVWEVSELGSTTRRADVDALKWFLTLESVVVRRPYGRFDIEKPALASFIGTVNPDGVGFLTDTTGNRRFRPVFLQSIDRRYSTACNVSQIWAEAVDAYRNGETADLPAMDEKRLREDILPKGQMTNLMAELIQEHYTHCGENDDPTMCRKTTSQILLRLYNCGYRGKNSRIDAMELAQAMQLLKYEKYRTMSERGFQGIVERT